MRYTQDFLGSRRHIGDDLADEVIQHLKDHPEVKAEFQQISSNEELIAWRAPAWMHQLIKQIVSGNYPCSVAKGQLFFEEHLPSIMALLGLYSLPYCYAAANGAKVLIHSKNIIENPGQRLGETAQFVLDVCRKGAFSLNGRGYVAILKVRLMHAAIRYHASRHITFETPINQEDLAGTNLSFSLLIIRGLKKLGKVMTEQEIADYLQMWNFIGHRLGIESSLLPESSKAFYQLEKGIRKHQFRRSKEGDKLVHALLEYFDQNQSGVSSFVPRVAMAAFMGDEVASYLNISSSQIAQSAAISIMRSSQFFLNFISDHYQWVKKSIASQMERHEFEEMFVIPI